MLAIRIKTDGIAMSLDKNVTDIEIVEEVNTISKLSFTVYPNTNAYDLIGPSVTKVVAYDTFLKKVVFEGRVYSCDDEMDSSGVIFKKLECENVMSYFCDSAVCGITFLGNRNVEVNEQIEYREGVPLNDIIVWLVENHNAQVNGDMQISLGAVYSGSTRLTKTIEIDNDNTFNVLKQVIEEMKWEFIVKYRQGAWYLYVGPSASFVTESSLTIISGVNMLNISKKASTEDICTRILPLGSVGYLPWEYREDITPVGSERNWAEQARLTLHGYDTEEHPHPRIVNDKYIQNDAMVAKYGIITKTVVYDDILVHDDNDFEASISELYRRGCAEADKLTDIEESYETNAIDLARGGYDYDSLFVGYVYRIQNPMMNIDTVLRITSKTLKYDDPTASTLKFGKIGITMSNDAYKKNISLTRRLNANTFNAAKNTNYRLGGMSLRNITQSTYDNMPNHLDDTIYVATGSQGEIKMYKGDTEISRGGRVENAAIVTNAQASQIISDEQIIFVDTTLPARVVWGKHGNWFYLNGYPVYFQDAQTIQAYTDTFLEDFDEPFFPAEIEMYVYINQNTTYKRRIYCEITQMQFTTVSSAQKKRYTVAHYYDEYRMIDNEWVLYSTGNRGSGYTSVNIDIDPNDELTHLGMFVTSNNLRFGNTNVATPAIYYVYKSSSDTNYKFASSTYHYSSGGYGDCKLMTNAEIIFAKGMTATTLEVNS